MDPYFTYSPKRDKYLNNFPVGEEEPVGYTPDGTPIYEMQVPKQSIPQKDMAVAAAAGLGLNEVLGGIGGGVSEGASHLASTAAENAAWNSAATGGEVLPEVAAAPGMFDLAGIGSAGNAILPLAGVASLYNLSQNRKRIGTRNGYLQGAATGAAIGSFASPAGAAIGAGVGLLANALGIGHKSRTKIEQDRRKQLKEQGIEVPNYDTKEWEDNAAFRESRNEADLKGGDIENAAAFYGIEGYKDLEQAKKEAIAQEAINQGLIREHHGTIDLNLNDAYKAYLDKELGGGTPAPTQNNSGPSRQEVAERKRERKKAALVDLIPDIEAQITQAPRYDLNPGNLIRNPYL